MLPRCYYWTTFLCAGYNVWQHLQQTNRIYVFSVKGTVAELQYLQNIIDRLWYWEPLATVLDSKPINPCQKNIYLCRKEGRLDCHQQRLISDLHFCSALWTLDSGLWTVDPWHILSSSFSLGTVDLFCFCGHEHERSTSTFLLQDLIPHLQPI